MTKFIFLLFTIMIVYIINYNCNIDGFKNKPCVDDPKWFTTSSDGKKHNCKSIGITSSCYDRDESQREGWKGCLKTCGNCATTKVSRAPMNILATYSGDPIEDFGVVLHTDKERKWVGKGVGKGKGKGKGDIRGYIDSDKSEDIDSIYNRLNAVEDMFGLINGSGTVKCDKKSIKCNDDAKEYQPCKSKDKDNPKCKDIPKSTDKLTHSYIKQSCDSNNNNCSVEFPLYKTKCNKKTINTLIDEDKAPGLKNYKYEGCYVDKKPYGDGTGSTYSVNMNGLNSNYECSSRGVVKGIDFWDLYWNLGHKDDDSAGKGIKGIDTRRNDASTGQYQKGADTSDRESCIWLTGKNIKERVKECSDICSGQIKNHKWKPLSNSIGSAPWSKASSCCGSNSVGVGGTRLDLEDAIGGGMNPLSNNGDGVGSCMNNSHYDDYGMKWIAPYITDKKIYKKGEGVPGEENGWSLAKKLYSLTNGVSYHGTATSGEKKDNRVLPYNRNATFNKSTEDGKVVQNKTPPSIMTMDDILNNFFSRQAAFYYQVSVQAEADKKKIGLYAGNFSPPKKVKSGIYKGRYYTYMNLSGDTTLNLLIEASENWGKCQLDVNKIVKDEGLFSNNPIGKNGGFNYMAVQKGNQCFCSNTIEGDSWSDNNYRCGVDGSKSASSSAADQANSIYSLKAAGYNPVINNYDYWERSFDPNIQKSNKSRRDKCNDYILFSRYQHKKKKKKDKGPKRMHHAHNLHSKQTLITNLKDKHTLYDVCPKECNG